MMNMNSPTVQNMLRNTPMGMGNMNIPIYSGNIPTMETVTVPSPSPFPSPKDMVMSMGTMPIYQSNSPSTPLYPNGFGMVQQPMNNPMMNNNPNMFVNNQIPEEYRMFIGGNNVPQQAPVFNPYMMNGQYAYNQFAQPGMPMLVGQQQGLTPLAPPPPGRAFPSLNETFPSPKYYKYQNGQSMPAVPTASYNPFGNNPSVVGTPGDIMGQVNYYDGKPVHPDSHPGWYGNQMFPYQPKDLMKEAVSQFGFNNPAFAGYYNPYMQYQTPRPQYSPEVRQTANLAAFYGMTYNQFMKNSSDAYKSMARAVNKSLGMDDITIDQAQKAFEFTPLKQQETYNPYFARFNSYADTRNKCIDKEKIRQSREVMRVQIVEGDEVIVDSQQPGHGRYLTESETLRKNTGIRNFDNALLYSKAANICGIMTINRMYDQAPERKFDKVTGTAVEVFNKIMTPLYVDNLERRRYKEMDAGSGRLFSAPAYISKLVADNQDPNQALFRAGERIIRTGESANNAITGATSAQEAFNREIGKSIMGTKPDADGKIRPRPGYDIGGNKLPDGQESTMCYDTVTGKFVPDFESLRRRMEAENAKVNGVQGRIGNFVNRANGDGK